MTSMSAAQILEVAAVRWLSLSALAVLIGMLVLDVAILPPGAPELAGARRRLRRWIGAAVVVLAAASVGELILRARTMSGGGFALALSVVPLVLTRTHFGLIWMARLATLGVLLGLSPASGRALRLIALVLAFGVALSTSLTGHAADWGDVTVTAVVDWGHVLAASAWAGGLVGLTVLARAERNAWPPILFASVVRRFSTLAGLCLLVVVGSGLHNVWWQLSAPSQLWTTEYGRVLAIKLLVVLALIGLGAVNRYALIPRLDGARRPAGFLQSAFGRIAASGLDSASVSSRLTTNVAREALLALVVLACTALLGEFSPARQVHKPMHHMETGQADDR